MDWVVISVVIGGLVAAVPGWYMCQTAYFCSRWGIVTAMMAAVLTAAMTAGPFWLVFTLAKGKELKPYDTLNDLMLFGVAPLALIALAAYVADHFSESPVRKLIAGSACFAIAALPILYFFYAERMHTEMNIQITPYEVEILFRGGLFWA